VDNVDKPVNNLYWLVSDVDKGTLLNNTFFGVMSTFC